MALPEFILDFVSVLFDLMTIRKLEGPQGWPLIEAEIREARIQPIDTMAGRNYMVRLAYSFVLKKRSYSGEWERCLVDETAARALLDRARRRGYLKVRRRARRPKDVMVLDTDNPELR